MYSTLEQISYLYAKPLLNVRNILKTANVLHGRASYLHYESTY